MPMSSPVSRRARRVRAHRPKRGFSVVEVIVAIVLLGVALSTLGVLAFQTSRRNALVANAAYRAAAMRYLFDRYSALNYADLDPATQTMDSTVAAGPMPHRLVAQFVAISNPNEKQVRLIVVPANALVAPETTFVRRFRWATENPLNSTSMGL